LTGQARELLFKEGYDPTYGARPLKRALQHQILDKLALKILDGDFLPGDHILVDADWSKGTMTFNKLSSEKQVR
jgi:ATP-dependent Clp protease ATP-binding subunit ClpB